MSSIQTSLLSGDALSQYRFTLRALISERLAAVREYQPDRPGDLEWGLVALLDDLGQLAAELRRIGDVDDAVPF